ncbi:hypothetical protein BCY76_014140 [Nesterenkonia sp. PF2B19]|nr:hypothetical protein BCY76_014140 [Nesterenkonia sp. PF2B19]
MRRSACTPSCPAKSAAPPGDCSSPSPAPCARPAGPRSSWTGTGPRGRWSTASDRAVVDGDRINLYMLQEETRQAYMEIAAAIISTYR